MNPDRYTQPGLRRRAIEGEGLGGFARRPMINVEIGGVFGTPLKIFSG
jgi:hypothetical protein